jgi:hypothetical protein
MELECFSVVPRPPELVPGGPARTWMDKFSARHPYRCLPLTMANTFGWELLCPFGFTAEWTGHPHQDAITITPDRPQPNVKEYVTSHFSHGTLTFHTGYLFRSEPGWSMWTSGPPNHIKDGIFPLTGLIETDWLPFPFTMNWVFTRPGRIRFEKDEPFCWITLLQQKPLDTVEPVQRSLGTNPPLMQQYEAWRDRRDEFNKRLARFDPAAIKEAWQRFYFKGELPADTGLPPPKDHVNKRRLKAPRLGF